MFGKYEIFDDHIRFACGCQFKYNNDGVEFSRVEIPLDCKLTWELFAQGLTLGVFQLESGLGRHWSKRLKPEEIEHLAALTAILRPGAIESLDENNISITEHYCRRKNNEEDATPICEQIKEIVKDSYQLMIYQEHSIQVAQAVAGFSGGESAALQKSIGKKNTEIMEKCKKMFLEGCEKTGKVDENTAVMLFDIIEKSVRYQFNHSHSVGYALESFKSAYIKAHFPVEFFTGCLSSGKKHDVPFLVEDAKFFNIKTIKPDLFKVHDSPFIEDESIILSMSNIKGVGEAKFENVVETVKNNKIPNWLTFLVVYSDQIGLTVAENLIKAGALDVFGYPRKKMLYELSIWGQITNTQKPILVEKYTQENYNNLFDFLSAYAKLKKDGGIVHASNGLKKYLGLLDLLKNPPHSLEDTPGEIAAYERELLGISLTNDRLDGYTTGEVNTSCLDLKGGKHGKNMLMAVEITQVNINEVRSGQNKGKKYAKLVVRDRTGEFELSCFSKEYQECCNEIYENAIVLMRVDSLFNNQGYKISKIQPVE